MYYLENNGNLIENNSTQPLLNFLTFVQNINSVVAVSYFLWGETPITLVAQKKKIIGDQDVRSTLTDWQTQNAQVQQKTFFESQTFWVAPFFGQYE